MKSKKFKDRSFTNAIKIQDLRMIVTLCDQGTILRTADAMQLSQPAITKRLQDLEKELNITLFNRMSRGVEPTPYGEILIKHAHIILNQLRYAEDESSDLKAGKGGRLKIGVPVAAASELVSNTITNILNKRNDIQISLEEDYNIRLIPKLKQGDLDMIIGRLPLQSQYDDLDTVELYKEELILVVRNSHPLLEKKSVNFKDLINIPWMMPLKDSIIYKQLEDFFRSKQLKMPRATIHSLSQSPMIDVLKNNDLVAAFPEESVRGELKNNVIKKLPIKLTAAASPVGIILREGSFISPASEEFIETLKETAKNKGK